MDYGESADRRAAAHLFRLPDVRGFGSERKATPIPPVIPETEEEKRRYREAGERREYRLAHAQTALASA